LRGFFNVCRHRAGPLAEGWRFAEAVPLRLSTWTYGLDGSLISAPDSKASPVSMPGNSRLSGASRGWFNLIFVNLDPSARPLVSSLGQLPGQRTLWLRRG